jgi:hypothetical protein
MNGPSLPDGDHIVRLCGGSHIREDGTIAPPAFRVRRGEEYLSVNWLEQLGIADQYDQLAEVRRVLATKRTVGAKACLALLQVGRVRTLPSSANAFVTLDVRHVPQDTPPDPSHSGIYGIGADDLIVPEQLATNVMNSFPAK